jgi:hypothetical protein
MDNFFEKIFSEDPKPPKSISLEIDVLENENQTETKISDIFEICLHMFVYGIKYKKLEFIPEHLAELKKYFNSVSLDFIIEVEDFDTSLFNDLRYTQRYFTIDPDSFNMEYPMFITNARVFTRSKLPEWIATYQLDYESMFFICFRYI